jgi:hypothetical protein
VLKCLSSVVYEYATHLGFCTKTDFDAFGVTLLGFIATELAVNARVTRNGVACFKTANFLL